MGYERGQVALETLGKSSLENGNRPATVRARMERGRAGGVESLARVPKVGLGCHRYADAVSGKAGFGRGASEAAFAPRPRGCHHRLSDDATCGAMDSQNARAMTTSPQFPMCALDTVLQLDG